MLNELAKILLDKKLIISTAESCTGGLLSSLLTDISGSSAYIHSNYVTYANDAKHEILNVAEDTLSTFGAVSEECAIEMANGLMRITNCDIALCTTGIAGPTGGTKDKPVGLCYISCKYRGQVYVKKLILNSDINRIEMKRKFAQNAIDFAYEVLTTY